MDARLVRPAPELEGAYRAMLADWGDEPRVPFTLDYDAADFPALLARLAAEAAGALPAGRRAEAWVPHSCFWLVDAAGAIVATSNLRHALTDGLRVIGGHIGYGVPPSSRRRGYATEVLRQTLREAAALGIERALLTCDKSNTGSVRTITANGGVLDSEEFVASAGDVVQRYWIDTIRS